jgi:hypothetical protein
MGKVEAASAYIGVNILLLLVLAFLVVGVRRRAGIALGDGGNEDLQRAIRVHGNASEYIPPAAIGLLALALLPAAPLWSVHVGGGLLTLGRVAHALGLSRASGRSLGRMVGTLSTRLALLGIGGMLVVFAVLPG